LKLTGYSQAAAGASRWLGKLVLDIDDIQPGSLGATVPISHVIILQNPATIEDSISDGLERELSILVDRLDSTLLDAVRDIEGVTDVYPDTERGYPTLRIKATHRMSALSQIEAVCQARQVLILDVCKRVERPPTFETPARLQAISKSQATMELLRRFQGGHKSALLREEFDGSSVRLFIELAEIVERASCHQLFVGPLHEMGDLVCGLVAE
jgi:hypothetical protein